MSRLDISDYKYAVLPTLYQQVIHLREYSRWRDDLGRRETWPETVDRYMRHMDHQAQTTGWRMGDPTYRHLFESILKLDSLPSMRALMTAGPALERDHVAAYNCAYDHAASIDTFAEAIYILMCGCGDGYSVERQLIKRLPELPDKLVSSDVCIHVRDDRAGWCDALKALLTILYSGQVPSWNLSKIRPAGARLRTFGGRASGPGPLNDLLRFVVAIFEEAVKRRGRDGGDRLTSSQVHAILCKIGEAVVAGGVRRTALISLSNPSDDRMRTAKSGAWFLETPYLQFANNSAAYTETPEMSVFMDEWYSLYQSKSGERGIFNRRAAQRQAARWGRRAPDLDYGVNPCGEIILRPKQFCNLSSAVVRHDDDEDSLDVKLAAATALGTIQSTFTNFRYLDPEWAANCEEERLLGVSLTGVYDNPLYYDLDDEGLDARLANHRDNCRRVNAEVAGYLGIRPSAAITCVKPHGNSSQLVDARSGLHPAHAVGQYIRTIRGNKVDPVSQFMRDQGFPAEDDVGGPDTRWVFSFPMKTPETSVARSQISAVEHMTLWLKYVEHYCEHSASVTINVREKEWMQVGAFVYEHFDRMTGLTFIPYSEHGYAQAPYQECSQEEHSALGGRLPAALDYEALRAYEQEDSGHGGERAYACVGGACEV